ncbi:hypothetical protein GW915_00175 [bacterium]|nr:hypothetical protein [bacterium]
MRYVVAGEMLSLECPNSSLPLLKEGAVFPQKEQQFYVYEAKGSSITLAPLTAGRFNLTLECSNDQKIEEEIEVKPLQSMPKHEAPLNPITQAYPMWFWWLIGGALLLSLLTIVLVKYLKKKNIKIIPQKRELTLSEKMEKALKKAQTKQALDSAAKQEHVKEYYSDIIQIFRDICDKVYETHTEFYTSSEFIGTLRSISLQKGINPQRMGQIESFMLRGDQVRFAKYYPTTEERKMFVGDVEEVFKILKLHLDAQLRNQKKEGANVGNR